MNQYEKLALANYSRYLASKERTLYDAYGKFSKAKANAYDYCINLMKKCDGYDLKILSHNTYMFTAGFEFVDKETGVCRFMYITPSRNTAVDI